MAEFQDNNSIAVEPPHSIAQASVDDKGRLKLPEKFLEYLEAIKVTQVFITTFDLRLGRIYPLPVWKRNEELFYNAGENAAAAERLAFLAKVYGGDAEIDKSGRVLLPVKLREALGLEKQPVWLDVYNGRINLVTKKIHDERMQLATASMADDLRTLEKLGLK
jgi:DNA-binding transcriptional regulator/RsmH inhibitor MraZ